MSERLDLETNEAFLEAINVRQNWRKLIQFITDINICQEKLDRCFEICPRNDKRKFLAKNFKGTQHSFNLFIAI